VSIRYLYNHTEIKYGKYKIRNTVKSTAIKQRQSMKYFIISTTQNKHTQRDGQTDIALTILTERHT